MVYFDYKMCKTLLSKELYSYLKIMNL